MLSILWNGNYWPLWGKTGLLARFLNVILILLLSYKVYSETICHATTQTSWNSGDVNLFTLEPPPPPLRTYLTSAACDIISFNGQGQFCWLICAGWRDLSNHKKNEHDSVKDAEKKANNHVTLTQKFPWKSCSSTHLPFLSSNPKILKAFPKTVPTKMNPTECLVNGSTTEAPKHVFRQNSKDEMLILTRF